MKDLFPFAFDFKPMTDAFKENGFEKLFAMAPFDMSALRDAGNKNLAAMTEANKVAIAGYQAILKRQQELFEEALADAKTHITDMQSKPVSTETALDVLETMKTAFEQAMTDLKAVADMATGATKEAFEILKARGEEAMSEMKAATDKPLH